MKKVLFLSFIFFACGTPKEVSPKQDANLTKQSFIANQMEGLPGKCYQKMILEDKELFTEILCQTEINKGLIKQIHADLMRRDYEIDAYELSKNQLGKTSKKALKDFQLKNNMAYGGLDWATINRLKSE